MAFFFIPLVTTTLSSIEPERIPATPGLSNFVRILVGSFCTSIATTMWQNRASVHHAQLSEFVSPGVGATNGVMSGLAGAGLTPSKPWAASTGWLTSRPTCWQPMMCFMRQRWSFWRRKIRWAQAVRMRRLGRIKACEAFYTTSE